MEDKPKVRHTLQNNGPVVFKNAKPMKFKTKVRGTIPD